MTTSHQSRFAYFVANGGKFRVAIVDVCNLDCFFCHNEGMVNPRRAKADERPAGRRLTDDDLIGIVNAYTELGGAQVNITGGEPLAHKDIVGLLRRIEPRRSRIVLNTNALLAERLLAVAPLPQLHGILASLHTTDDAEFATLGGRSCQRVMDNIVALARHGYDMTINYSLGSYNVDSFGAVLDFAVANGIRLKAIALVRPHEASDFYRGPWVDPQAIEDQLQRRRGVFVSERQRFGGISLSYRVGESEVVVKNIARGRLHTDYCDGCEHLATCGEGIYGLRVGTDGLWKPCLLRKDKFSLVDARAFREQILEQVAAMVGESERARFVAGAPL